MSGSKEFEAIPESAIADEGTPALAATDDTALLKQAWGALNFILAFYEPGQRYLDTNAWTQAEASGRRAHAALRARIDELKRLAQDQGQ